MGDLRKSLIHTGRKADVIMENRPANPRKGKDITDEEKETRLAPKKTISKPLSDLGSTRILSNQEEEALAEREQQQQIPIGEGRLGPGRFPDHQEARRRGDGRGVSRPPAQLREPSGRLEGAFPAHRQQRKARQSPAARSRGHVRPRPSQHRQVAGRRRICRLALHRHGVRRGRKSAEVDQPASARSPWPTPCTVAIACAKALQYAHAQGHGSPRHQAG